MFKILNTHLKNSKHLEIICVFIVSYVIHLICNFCVPIIRFNPDELGSLMAAARFAGKDWNVLWAKVNAYYGVAFGILFTPFMKYIQNPFLLYQVMLAIIALFHSSIAPLAYHILTKYYDIPKNGMSFIMALGCSFMVTWRANNLMNETPLLLSVWLIFFLFVKLLTPSFTHNNLVMLILCMCLAWLSHTRGIIVIIATLISLLIYTYLSSTNGKKSKRFILFSLLFFSLTRNIIALTEETVFSSPSSKSLHNTLSFIGDGITQKTAPFDLEHILGFLDMFCGNVYSLFIVTLGTIFISAIIIASTLSKYTWKKVFQKSVPDSDYIRYFPGLFCVLGIIGSLLAYSYINIEQAVAAHQYNVTISYYLYPRYFGIYAGPLLLLLFVFLYNGKKIWKYTLFSLLLFLSSFAYSFFRFLYVSASRNGDVLDSWRILVPLTFETYWRKGTNVSSYVWCTIICSLILLIIMLIRRNSWKKGLIIFIAVFLTYQYVITSFVFDRGISQYCYGLVDQTYKLLNQDILYDSFDTLYVDSNANGRTPYMLQFLLMDKKISITSDDIREGLIFSTNLNMGKRVTENYQYVTIDDKGEYPEYLIIKGQKYIDLLKGLGYTSKSF